MSHSKKPTALIILDGWGVSDSAQDNAISAANTPTWDRLWSHAPHSMVETSGLAVGLPEGQMGNSEVGHMSMGAGRVVYQNFTLISKAIETGTFFENPVLAENMDKAISQGKAIHLIGLLSPGGVHGHERHIQALCEMAVHRGAQKVYVHAMLDGRDMPPQSAQPSIEGLEAKLAELGIGAIATVIGRFYTMDRDRRWERVRPGYDAMTLGKAPFYCQSAMQAMEEGYARGETDEFVQATVITDADGRPQGVIDDGDTVICTNFRPDRAREITRAFVEPDFDGFPRERCPALSGYVMMTEYAGDIHTPCAYPPEAIHNGLGEYIAGLGRTQLRLAETEKYAHVTFFFNCGREEQYPGEERVLVPSPAVATYDLKPEMSAHEVTDVLVDAIKSDKFDLIVCNYANPDMVGHTGNFDAAVQAVEVIDGCLARITAALEESGGQALITADHGNVELMKDPYTRQPHTSHTSWPVGLVYAGPQQIALRNGSLADLAPTLLTLMELPVPEEMTGHSLLV